LVGKPLGRTARCGMGPHYEHSKVWEGRRRGSQWVAWEGEGGKVRIGYIRQSEGREVEISTARRTEDATAPPRGRRCSRPMQLRGRRAGTLMHWHRKRDWAEEEEVVWLDKGWVLPIRIERADSDSRRVRIHPLAVRHVQLTLRQGKRASLTQGPWTVPTPPPLPQHRVETGQWYRERVRLVGWGIGRPSGKWWRHDPVGVEAVPVGGAWRTYSDGSLKKKWEGTGMGNSINGGYGWVLMSPADPQHHDGGESQVPWASVAGGAQRVDGDPRWISIQRMETMGILATMVAMRAWVRSERGRGCRKVIHHLDNQGAVTRWGQVMSKAAEDWYKLEDRDLWRSIVAERAWWGEDFEVRWVESHVEKRKPDRTTWVDEDWGNVFSDRWAEAGRTLPPGPEGGGAWGNESLALPDWERVVVDGTGTQQGGKGGWGGRKGNYHRQCK
jgi:hypothetical protein